MKYSHKGRERERETGERERSKQKFEEEKKMIERERWGKRDENGGSKRKINRAKGDRNTKATE